MATKKGAQVVERETKPIIAITNIAANMHENAGSAKAEEHIAELPVPEAEVADSIAKRRHENEGKHAQLAQ